MATHAELRQSANASGGNEVGVDGESVALEYVVARLHHAGVVVVDVAHVEPGPHAVGGQLQPSVLHDAEILLEKHDGLCV